MAKQIEVIRIFNAPVQMVWKVWTDPELLKRWWGPEHFTSPVAEIDFREGGKTVVSMKAPIKMGGQEWFSIWEYVKIIPFETIEFIQNLSDGEGNRVNPMEVGMPPDFPVDIRTLVTFRESGNNQTILTVTEFADFGSMSNSAQLGLEQSLDKMMAIIN